MKGIKMELTQSQVRELADKVALASVNDAIPLGGFASKLCQAYCHADSGNRHKILAGFSGDFVSWYMQWHDEIETRYN